MKKDLDMLKANEVPMIQNGDVVKFMSVCDGCGGTYVEELSDNPSNDSHGVHGISLCDNC
jgi:hypothetical protein